MLVLFHSSGDWNKNTYFRTICDQFVSRVAKYV